ncbi:MAG: argininosuccinate lyase [Clostridiales Family XIII bacterium]|jgi:argininosuccinate lyase|nr:argininosuccinate lyase [Clostridiales Family XIII bacterium]
MKLWGGRFSKNASSFVDEWAASIDFDQILYKDDIKGSIAHSKMLAKQGIISKEDQEQIETGLIQILLEIEDGKIEFTHELEDIHMNIESILTDRIGDAGKRLHTARSRNDQVATDIRLFLKDEITNSIKFIDELRAVLVKIAKNHVDTVMPGYTHMQHAQPVSFAFHLLAYYEMFTRDKKRMENAYESTDALPLGAGALSGTTYDTDRDYVRHQLGMESLCANAMDAVSDRDFAIEYISAASICMMHLSRFCEELILWSSSEFSFVEMDDSFSTGSSIMPQKKNPDMAELIRGKTGRVYGDLVSLLTIMKSLPLAYNKDMQEDKIHLFDAVETLNTSLKVFTEMIDTMSINKDYMRSAAKKGFMNATDAADYLVKKGIPFRQCHEIIGKLVLYCIGEDLTLEEVALDKLKEFSDQFDEDIYEHIGLLACMDAKQSVGSTSQVNVRAQIERAEAALSE